MLMSLSYLQVPRKSLKQGSSRVIKVFHLSLTRSVINRVKTHCIFEITYGGRWRHTYIGSGSTDDYTRVHKLPSLFIFQGFHFRDPIVPFLFDAEQVQVSIEVRRIRTSTRTSTYSRLRRSLVPTCRSTPTAAYFRGVSASTSATD